MAKKKPIKLEVPKFMGPIEDLIPNEVMYDAFKLNVWVGVFIATFGLLHNLDKAAAEAAAEDEDKGSGFSLSGFLDTTFKVASPAYTLGRSWVPGFDPFGTGDDATDTAVQAVMVDWEALKVKAKDDDNDIAFATYSVLGNQFIRNAILASSAASLMVYVTFEKDAVSAAIAASGEIVKGIGEIVPG